MTLIDAIKSGRPLRRQGKSTWLCRQEAGSMFGANTLTGYMSVDFLLGACVLDAEDVLATDWEIKEKTIEVSRSMIMAIAQEDGARGRSGPFLAAYICNGLGLDP